MVQCDKLFCERKASTAVLHAGSTPIGHLLITAFLMSMFFSIIINPVFVLGVIFLFPFMFWGRASQPVDRFFCDDHASETTLGARPMTKEEHQGESNDSHFYSNKLEKE